jgi:hypothetical protein
VKEIFLSATALRGSLWESGCFLIKIGVEELSHIFARLQANLKSVKVLQHERVCECVCFPLNKIKLFLIF